MSSRSTDFELIVGVVAARDDAIKRYLVQVFSPAGVGSAEIALDPTDPSFANPVSAASGEGPNLDGRKAAGELLFERLFLEKEVKKLWDQSIGQLRAGGFDLLRVRLWIADPALASLPWELLTWEGSYLATRPDITVSRYLPGPEPAYLEPVERVHVLVVVSRPSKGNLPEIPDEVSSRFKTMFEELKPAVEWTLVENPDLSRLQTEISQGCHILHYLGHGEPNHLILTKPDGSPMRVHVSSLSQLVAGRRSLRLILLNACGSSQSSPADLFSGVGPGLIHLGVPAVVAMQYGHAELEPSITFNKTLYQKLCLGKAVDLAVNEARQTISAERLEERNWSTPVLYLGTRGGHVLDVAKKQGDSIDQWAKLTQAAGEAAYARQALEEIKSELRDLAKRVQTLDSLVGIMDRIQQLRTQATPLFRHEGPEGRAISDEGYDLVVALGPTMFDDHLERLARSIQDFPQLALTPWQNLQQEAETLRKACQIAAMKRIPASLSRFRLALDRLELAAREAHARSIRDVTLSLTEALGRFGRAEP
ncbi:MAG: CHAT domain-containing protein [Isosphaerales bacterium]